MSIALASAALPALAQPALTLNAEPADTGYVARYPNASDYVAGEEITVTATPAPGFEFVGWVGDIESDYSSFTFVPTADTTLTAVFAESTIPDGVDAFGLSAFVEPSGAGTIVRDPALFEYADGTEVTLHAFAGEGFVFTGWSGDLPEGADAENPELVLTMTDNLSVRANFSAGLVLDDESGKTVCGSVGAVGMLMLMGAMLTLKLSRSRRG